MVQWGPASCLAAAWIERGLMDTKESIAKEFHEIERCKTRETCPFGTLCGVSRSGHGKPLVPRVLPQKKGDFLWTNLRFENHVFVVKKGVFISIGLNEYEEEIPFSILGEGNAIGLAEAYTAQEISDYYHLRCFTDGEICMMPTKVVKRKLEELSQQHTSQIISRVFVSQSVASFTQLKIMSKRTLSDRIVALLIYLQDIGSRNGISPATFEITHEEIAMMVASDRVSTTRVLHKLVEKGIVSIGYKSITLHNEKLESVMHGFEAYNFFETQNVSV